MNDFLKLPLLPYPLVCLTGDNFRYKTGKCVGLRKLHRKGAEIGVTSHAFVSTLNKTTQSPLNIVDMSGGSFGAVSRRYPANPVSPADIIKTGRGNFRRPSLGVHHRNSIAVSTVDDAR